MAGTLGTIKGQMVLDVKQALAAYTQARQAHVSTVTALRTGGGALQTAGAGIAGVGFGIAAGLIAAVSASATFEKRISYFGAVSGATASQLDAVRNRALQLGKDTIFTANEVADSFVELGKSGVSAQDIVNGIGKAVTSLGAAADIPLATAANIITAAVATFGLSAQQAVGVADKLAGAANASIIDVQDLGVSLKYTGGVAHALHIPFEQVNTALALLGKYGIKGSTAGTSLRQVLVSLTGGTKAAHTELKNLGIITADGSNKFFDAKGHAKSLADIFQILQNATKGMGDEQKLAAYKTIFAQRAISTVAALTNAGADGFKKMNGEINKTTAAEVASKRLNNLAGDVEILKGSLDTAMVSAGSTVQTFARGFIQNITKLVNAFISLPKGTQKMIMEIAAIAAVVLIVVGFIGIFAGAILNIIALGMILAPVFAAIGAAIGAVAGVVGSLFALLLANPIVLIIALIIALVAGLVWFFTQTALGKEVWANFCKFLAEAWTNIVNVAKTVWGAIVGFFQGVWNGIVTGVHAFIGFIVNAFLNFTPEGLIISHWGQIIGFFAGVWNAIVAGISGFVKGVIGFFTGLPAAVAAIWARLPYLVGFAIGLLLGTIVRVFLGIGAFLFITVPNIVRGVVGFFAQLPGRVLTWIQQMSIRVETAFIAFGVGVLLHVASLIGGVVGFFQALPARIYAFVLRLAALAVIGFGILRGNAIRIAAAVITGVISFFAQLPGRAAAFFVAAANRIRSAFNAAVGFARTVANNIFNGVRDAINGLPGLVGGIFNNVVAAVRNSITGAFNAVRDFGAGIWNGFKKGMGINSPSFVEKAITQMTNHTDSETRKFRGQVQILQGLGTNLQKMGANTGFNTDGIKTSVKDLYDQVKAAKALDTELAGGKTLGKPNTATTLATAVHASLKDLKTGDTTYNVNVNNPSAEPASDSIPKSIRKTAYMVGS